MSIYHVMARYYDALTADVPYTEFVEFLLRIFQKEKASPQLILDLACGTGTVSKLLAERGYDVIGADSSPDMLSEALNKCASLSNRPAFICQSMTGLDLYGTVDAVVSFLDSVNYLADPADLQKAFARVSLFLNPGGLFVFDLNTLYKLSSLSGGAFVRETDDLFCVWQAAWDEKTKLAGFYLDFFEKQTGCRYRRQSEDHLERGYTPEEIRPVLEMNGMELLHVYGNLKFRSPKADEDRIFLVARKKP